MKELSIEQKAKAYDEAIERVENIMTGKCETTFMFTKGLFEHIFPELAESEEEKTKRMLHTIANKMSQHLRDIFTEEEFQCFDAWSNAWLEEQGEQKYKIQPKFKIGDIIRFKGNETLKGEAETHKIVRYDNELYVFDDGTTDLFCEQDLYELVEQKPILDVEIPFGAKDSELEEVTYDIPKGYHAEIDDNKVVIKNGNKKSSWSEEDEMQLDAAIHLVSSTGHIETANWLKSLRTQSHWKPSDEQMEYLAKAITTLGNEGDNKTSAILYELRTDLKKLK